MKHESVAIEPYLVKVSAIPQALETGGNDALRALATLVHTCGTDINQASNDLATLQVGTVGLAFKSYYASPVPDLVNGGTKLINGGKYLSITFQGQEYGYYTEVDSSEYLPCIPDRWDAVAPDVIAEVQKHLPALMTVEEEE